MGDESGLLTRLTRVLEEMRVEREALTRLHDELSGLIARWSPSSAPARPDLVLACVDLHGYYTALETLLERIARLVDRDVPAGPKWHIELVSQMKLDIPGIRPAVVPASIIGDLDELRRFRHFFRNVYVLDPDPGKVYAHALRVAAVHGPIAASLDLLEAHLTAVREALSAGL